MEIGRPNGEGLRVRTDQTRADPGSLRNGSPGAASGTRSLRSDGATFSIPARTPGPSPTIQDDLLAAFSKLQVLDEDAFNALAVEGLQRTRRLPWAAWSLAETISRQRKSLHEGV